MGLLSGFDMQVVLKMSYILNRVNFYGILVSDFGSAVRFCCISIPIVDNFKCSYICSYKCNNVYLIYSRSHLQ